MPALGAGMSWGASVVNVKNLQMKTSVSMLMITLRQMIIGSLLLALGWAWLEPQRIRWTVGFGLALGYTAVLATGVAWMLFYYALRRMPERGC
jgi:drug/metabolite transporter (DMT)-like permease